MCPLGAGTELRSLVARLPDLSDLDPFDTSWSCDQEVTGSNPARDVGCLANFFVASLLPTRGEWAPTLQNEANCGRRATFVGKQQTPL
jgi:hypothetical protein